jgi:outer membrane protein assembly factor BamA
MKGCYHIIILLVLIVTGFEGNAQDSAAVILQDHSPLVIADIQITGNRRTKLYIIQREIPFKKGDYFSRADLPAQLEICKTNITNSRLFVEVQVTSTQQGELAFINIHVKERWYTFPVPYFKIVDRNFNEWWVKNKRSLSRVNYGIKFKQYNASGRNDKVDANFIHGYSQQLNLRYTQPFAEKTLKWGFDVGFSYARLKELNINTSDSNKQQLLKLDDEFLSQAVTGTFAITYRPAIKTRHTWRLSYTNFKVTNDSVFKLNPNYFSTNSRSIGYPELTYSITHFDVDYIPYPNKGFTFTGAFIKKGFTKDVNLWQIHASATYTLPIFKKSALYFQATGMLKLPFDQPFFNKNLLGYGDQYMRGLEYYVIDGVAGIIGKATARREILNFNVRPPLVIKGHDKIPFRILLKAYGDLGYAYDRNPIAILNNKLLKTWGVGVDIISFYDIVIRLEYSFNQLGNDGLFLHSRGDF